MVSYKPLWHTLIDRGMKKMELVNLVGMSRATLSKLNNDEPVALTILDRICLVLDCPIEGVVEIKGRGRVGVPIPDMGDIVKIDGDKLTDKAGEEWDAGLVKINQALGGGFEICGVEDKHTPKKKSPDE